MEIELRECPFCGGDDLDHLIGGMSSSHVSVRCKTCLTAGPIRLERDDAVTAWNTRPRQSELEGIVGEQSKLIQAMMDNDPDDICADGGITMLMVWRKDAERTLTRARKKLEG